jgi:membrane protease YdiL (CAAX protease family)
LVPFSLWEDDGLRVFLLLLSAIGAYLMYWLTIESGSIRARFMKQNDLGRGSLRFFLFNKLWGTFWFGLVSTIVARLLFPEYPLRRLGLALPDDGRLMAVTLISGLILLPLLIAVAWLKNRGIARKKGDFGRYPEIGMKTWSVLTVVINAGFWSLYLFAYELLFRGVLLFLLAAELGFWPSIGINIALYSAVHIPKGAQEAVGALFLGFVFCVLALVTDSVLIPFLAHVAMAVTNCQTAFHYRSDTRFAGKRTI